MNGEKNLEKLLSGISPQLNDGEYVFISTKDFQLVKREDAICEFKEKEGVTFVIRKELADDLNLAYSFVAAWITLEIHSSLEAVGLTAAFSQALANNNISCNVIAGFYHDHIFVNHSEGSKAVNVIKEITITY